MTHALYRLTDALDNQRRINADSDEDLITRSIDPVLYTLINQLYKRLPVRQPQAPRP